MQKTSRGTPSRPRSVQPCSGAAEDGGRASGREVGPRRERGRAREGLRGLRAAPGAACSRRDRGSRRCRPLRLYRACMPKTEMVPVPVRSSFRWPCCRMCRTCCRYCGSPPSRPLDGSSAAGMAGGRRSERSARPGALLPSARPRRARQNPSFPRRGTQGRAAASLSSPPPPGGAVRAAFCSGLDRGRPLPAPHRGGRGVRAARAVGRYSSGNYCINIYKGAC